MKPSIQFKMTLLVAIILIAMMSLLLIGSFFLAEPVMIGQQKKNIQTLYYSLQQGYTDDAEALSSLVHSYEEGSFLRVEIFDAEGTLIYTSGRKMNEGFSGFQSPLPQQPPQKPEGEGKHPTLSLQENYSAEPEVLREIRGDADVLIIRGVFYTADGNRYVSIETPVEAISGTVRVLNRLTLIISIGVLVAGCLAAFLYASRFSRPIKAVSNTAKRVAALDFSHRAEENNSTAEIADLAISINSMSDHLEGFISQLMEKNRQLAEDNERLAKSEEMRRSFVANVSHDLKSPLAVLGGYAEMLKEHTAGIDPEACYDVIIQETATMDRMIRSMLEVSALENGLSKLQPRPMNFSEFLQELCSREQPLFEKKGISLLRSISPQLMISGDEELLARAVQNVLQNAMAHTAEGGVVELSLQQSGGAVILSVYNEGAPIPEDKLEKIWESFYKTDEARTRDAQNNVGLGLYIVHTIITAHGGACAAANERNGVAFRLQLPLLTVREFPTLQG